MRDRTSPARLRFFVWAAAGYLVVFGFVAGFSIGLPILALGLGPFTYLLFRGPVWPADLGLLAGVGAASLTFGAIALVADGFSPIPWIAIGMPLATLSAVSFWWLECRAERSA